jgi:hypothetical protein
MHVARDARLRQIQPPAVLRAIHTDILHRAPDERHRTRTYADGTMAIFISNYIWL